MAEVGAGTWEYQRQHYNSHVSNISTREALQQRSEGPAQELKQFHNHVKRQLIWRFAQRQDRLLDMCCGRGGDLHKWRDSQIKYVKGLDISEREVEEARRRYEEISKRRGGPPIRCEFEAVDWLGERVYEDSTAGLASYGVVTCMFALHYFFVSEHSLRMFLQNVALNLRQGGYFLGTIPSGQRVLELLGGQAELRTPMLRLERRWKGSRPGPFGAGYICDIADTVTSSKEGATEGSLEYLVDLPTLERLAAEAGLYPVTDYMDGPLMGCFEQEDVHEPFKRFKPFFLHSLQLDAVQGRPPPTPPSSLELASSLFVAFVFQKVALPEDITLPICEECTYPLPQGGPARRRDGGGGGGGGWGGGPGGPGGDPMMTMMGGPGGAPHFHPGELGHPHHPPPYGGGFHGPGGHGKRPGEHGIGGPPGDMNKRPRYGGPPGPGGGGTYG